MGDLVIPWTGGLLTWPLPRLQEGEVRGLEGAYRFALHPGGEVLLDPSRLPDREALSRLAQKRLETALQETHVATYPWA